MPAITREILNADAMSVTIYCGGQSTVGIGLLGTWAGTASFYGSTDGLNFFALSVTPFASGTDVNTTTANGNWFSAVKNMIAVKVTFTRTSGSLQVVLAAAVDASWQDAFLTASQVYVNSSSTGGTNTLTQAAQANRAWKCSDLEISVAGSSPAGGAAKLTIFDGTITGTALFSAYLTQVEGSVGRMYDITLPDGGIVGTPGNAMTLQLLGMGAGNASQINAKFSAA